MLFKQDKEKFVVPKSVQDCIPINTIYKDGIFKIGKNKYSKSVIKAREFLSVSYLFSFH